MKLNLPLACLLLLSLCFAEHVCGQVIQWDAERPLVWEDYQKKHTPLATDGLWAAKTVYKVEIEPLNVAVDANDNIRNYKDLTVVAQFFPRKSWVIERNEVLLNHEQLHFDIAELYARKMRYEFSKLQKSQVRRMDDYQEVYNRNWQACKRDQRQYDADTNHGTREEENKLWKTRIDAKLTTYAPFARGN
jgi:hypothetical protein